MQQLRDYQEIDMSDPSVLAAFLQRSYARFPNDGDRKYFLVLWDHGGGWTGYGIDHTCRAGGTYNSQGGCNMLSIPMLADGGRTSFSRIHANDAACPVIQCESSSMSSTEMQHWPLRVGTCGPLTAQ